MSVWHWLLVHTGTINESGPWYGFWSGFGSDIGELAIIGGLVTAYRAHTCHVDGCWRVGKHQVEGTPYRACGKHHPAVPRRVTAEHVAVAHQEAARV